MGFFRREPKIGLEDFCRQFYDSQIFHPVIAGKDMGSALWKTYFDSLVEADRSFKAIDFHKFQEEMTLIRLELFGLAWMKKFKRVEFTLPQEVLTRRYLQEKRKLKMYDAMEKYNQVIAESVTLSANGEQLGGAVAVIANKNRVDMLEKLVEAIKDDSSTTTKEKGTIVVCAVRIANRSDADIRRNDCIMAKRLCARAADRLGCDVNLNSEALFRLEAVIFGLYEGASEAIKHVNIQVS